MRGPYSFTVRDEDTPGRRNGLELAAASSIGLLADAERKGHLAAGEWVEAGIVERPSLEIFDANGTSVRYFHVYHDTRRGPKPLANTIVRERLS